LTTKLFSVYSTGIAISILIFYIYSFRNNYLIMDSF
jgi:hypothetical protein